MGSPLGKRRAQKGGQGRGRLGGAGCLEGTAAAWRNKLFCDLAGSKCKQINVTNPSGSKPQLKKKKQTQRLLLRFVSHSWSWFRCSLSPKQETARARPKGTWRGTATRTRAARPAPGPRRGRAAAEGASQLRSLDLPGAQPGSEPLIRAPARPGCPPPLGPAGESPTPHPAAALRSGRRDGRSGPPAALGNVQDTRPPSGGRPRSRLGPGRPGCPRPGCPVRDPHPVRRAPAGGAAPQTARGGREPGAEARLDRVGLLRSTLRGSPGSEDTRPRPQARSSRETEPSPAGTERGTRAPIPRRQVGVAASRLTWGIRRLVPGEREGTPSPRRPDARPALGTRAPGRRRRTSRESPRLAGRPNPAGGAANFKGGGCRAAAQVAAKWSGRAGAGTRGPRAGGGGARSALWRLRAGSELAPECHR